MTLAEITKFINEVGLPIAVAVGEFFVIAKLWKERERLLDSMIPRDLYEEERDSHRNDVMGALEDSAKAQSEIVTALSGLVLLVRERLPKRAAD